VYIAHCGIIDKALELKEALLGVDPKLNILIGHTGATMSTHTGPGMLGEFFFEKEKRW
jgi:fatty acid-binding protein DegV